MILKEIDPEPHLNNYQADSSKIVKTLKKKDLLVHLPNYISHRFLKDTKNVNLMFLIRQVEVRDFQMDKAMLEGNSKFKVEVR